MTIVTMPGISCRAFVMLGIPLEYRGSWIIMQLGIDGGLPVQESRMQICIYEEQLSMRLQYRTRGDSSPQGKQHVYYTGYPADVERCLDQIAEDILSRQNCAIYYDAEPEAAWVEEELRHEIEQMQLMVIPVTGQFLYRSNRAREVELPLALELHVPVLPIMLEPGIGADFNERCGDLQFMDRYADDPTAMPYAERLDQFLQNILVGDTSMEKVRAAFTAYAFLSYRKKDRRYAQEMMRLIHKNDFCRDLAIWYDEFLTPGENYNNAIEASLRKCNVFVMVITPNILEPDNYVMLREYPAAQGLDKPIMPLVAIQTSQEALADRYKGLPPCTDVHDEAALAAFLRDCLQETMQEGCGSTAEHEYYIGLAYLNGIDVEVDRERGLACIRHAAEHGLPEAMGQLADMYYRGNGVIRDYEEAMQWQRRLVDRYRETYEQTGIEGDGLRLYRAEGILGHRLDYLDRYVEALHAYEEQALLAEQLLHNQENPQTKDRYLNTYYLLGKQYMQIDNHVKAEETLQRLIPIVNKLQGKDLLSSWITACRIHDELGHLTWEDGRYEEAMQWYQWQIHIVEFLYERHPTTTVRDQQSKSYAHMGQLCASSNQIEQAREWYSKALAICVNIMKEEPSDACEGQLGNIYNGLYECCLSAGDDMGALHYAQLAVEISRRQAVEDDTVHTRRELAHACRKVANVNRRMARREQAEDWYRQATDIGEQLYDLTGGNQERRLLAAIYHDHGANLELCHHSEAALDAYRRALALGRDIPKDAVTEEDQRNNVTLLTSMAVTYSGVDQLDAAEECYLEAIEQCRQIYERTPILSVARQMLMLYYGLGGLYRKQDGERAIATLLEGYALAGRMTEDVSAGIDDRTVENVLVGLCLTLGCTYYDMDDCRLAEQYLDEAEEHARSIAQETGSYTDRLDVAKVLLRRGHCWYRRHEFAAARRHCMEALSIMRELYDETPLSEAAEGIAAIQELLDQMQE